MQLCSAYSETAHERWSVVNTPQIL